MGILKGVKDRIDVKVTANVDTDAGRTIKVPFIITSKKPMQDERKAILKAIEAGEVEDEVVVREYLLGWKGLVGSDGDEVPFNDESLHEVLQAPEYLRAVVKGIILAIAGKEALAKN